MKLRPRVLVFLLEKERTVGKNLNLKKEPIFGFFFVKKKASIRGLKNMCKSIKVRN